MTVSSGGRVKKGGCSSTAGVERDIWGGEGASVGEGVGRRSPVWDPS